MIWRSILNPQPYTPKPKTLSHSSTWDPLGKEPVKSGIKPTVPKGLTSRATTP